MTLNLFLITKGREEFLEPLLDSLNRALSREGISLSVVLNGASNKVISRFKEFEKRQSGKVSLHTLEDNDPRAASVWHIVKEVNSDWIAFPSDDDLLEDSFFKDFHNFEKEFSEFGAVATTLQVINQSGKKTRE
jgi:deoxyribodipyrimidine photolyase